MANGVTVVSGWTMAVGWMNSFCLSKKYPVVCEDSRDFLWSSLFYMSFFIVNRQDTFVLVK